MLFPEWSSGPCAYLRLSHAYDAEYEDAGHRGWPRSTVDGTHLGIYTDPVTVLDAIDDLTSRATTS